MVGSRWTRFGVNMPRTLDYLTINLNPRLNAPYDHNVGSSETDRRIDGRTDSETDGHTDEHHGNSATIRSKERIAR